MTRKRWTSMSRALLSAMTPRYKCSYLKVPKNRSNHTVRLRGAHAGADMPQQWIGASERRLEDPTAETQAVVGDHRDRRLCHTDQLLVWSEGIGKAPVGAQVVQTQDMLGFGNGEPETFQCVVAPQSWSPRQRRARSTVEVDTS